MYFFNGLLSSLHFASTRDSCAAPCCQYIAAIAGAALTKWIRPGEYCNLLSQPVTSTCRGFGAENASDELT